MNIITDFQHPNDSSFAGWMYAGKIIKKLFTSKIYALLLKSQKAVLILEYKNDKNNVAIYNGYGIELIRISNPDSQALCFGDVYYVEEKLTLISRRRDASMLAVIIDENGNIKHLREAR